MIKNMVVCAATTIITTKVMRNYARGECMLDAIFVVEAYLCGDQLNQFNYILQELFEAANDVYAWSTYFFLNSYVFFLPCPNCVFQRVITLLQLLKGSPLLICMHQGPTLKVL